MKDKTIEKDYAPIITSGMVQPFRSDAIMPKQEKTPKDDRVKKKV